MKSIFLTSVLLSILLLAISNAHIRKNYKEMTSDEKAAYVDAVYLLHTGIITECLPLMRR